MIKSTTTTILFRPIHSVLLEFTTASALSPTLDLNLNNTGTLARFGLPSCSNNRTHDKSESFVDVPVAQMAKIVPSSC